MHQTLALHEQLLGESWQMGGAPEKSLAGLLHLEGERVSASGI